MPDSKRYIVTVVLIVLAIVAAAFAGFDVSSLFPTTGAPTTASTQQSSAVSTAASTTASTAASSEYNSGLTFRTKEQLRSHYKKHGIEMGYGSAEAYQGGANAVVNNPEALHKLEAEDGDDVYYLESTNELVIVSIEGYIRTYFSPSSGKSYFDRQ